MTVKNYGNFRPKIFHTRALSVKLDVVTKHPEIFNVSNTAQGFHPKTRKFWFH